jgi:hypothetical protein
MTMLIDAEQRTPGLPADLRQHVGERALVELALDAAQTVGDRFPRPFEAAGRHSAQMLLTLLTYCYAAGVYGSEDIEYDCRHDATTRYLCANGLPDQDSIRSFRRANRPRIEDCLARVYRNACDLRPAEAGSEPGVAAFQAERRPDIAHFVRRKLELAIMIDTAMDE